MVFHLNKVLLFSVLVTVRSDFEKVAEDCEKDVLFLKLVSGRSRGEKDSIFRLIDRTAVPRIRLPPMYSDIIMAWQPRANSAEMFKIQAVCFRNWPNILV